MALWIEVSPGRGEPIYSQIVAQIARAIATGQVLPGDKLPAVRALAGELVVNPNTVARAYGEAERQGLVATKVGSGTFVADPSLRSHDAGALNILARRMDNVVAQCATLGLSCDDMERMFAGRVRAMLAGGKKGKDKS